MDDLAFLLATGYLIGPGIRLQSNFYVCFMLWNSEIG